MNNIVTNFPQIIAFAKQYNLPVTKQRAIIREYLQCQILDILYREKLSKNLVFVGGTSLRLLRNLDRFSEDLDFDIINLKNNQIIELINYVSSTLSKYNIGHHLYKNQTEKRIYFELRFTELLYELKLSNNQSDKLTIKFDFERFWEITTPEVLLLNRYGFLVNTVSLSQNQILCQKMYAYLNRKQTLSRDLYDIVWLLSFGAKIDDKFLKANHLNRDLKEQVIQKYQKEIKTLPQLKRRLKPFLVDEIYIDKIDKIIELINSI